MADIRIKDLPTGTPVQSKKLAMDLTTAESATIKDIVYVGRPAATEMQARTGTDADNVMTSVNVKQSIDEEVGETIASIAQGNLATTALQPASIGTTVQAYSANLQELSGTDPGVTGLALLGSATETTARDYLDPLKGFAADGVTDDTAKFTALRVAYPNTDFDLYGKTYRVSAVPNGPFHNGFFKIYDADNDADILFPTTGTLESRGAQITNGKFYSFGPQDKFHYSLGARYLYWNQGIAHGSKDSVVVGAVSTDGGISYSHRDIVFQSGNPDINNMCFSAGALNERQELFFMRTQNSSLTTTEYQLFGRRLYEYWPSAAYTMTTASGSPNIEVALGANHCCKTGDRINFASMSSPLNGVDLSGIKTVISVTATTVTVAGSANAGSSGSASRSVVVEFEPNTRWKPVAPQEILFGGLTFSAALIAAGVGVSSFPTVVHSFAYDPTGAGGCVVGLHGGGLAGPSVLKVNNVILSTRSIGSIKQVNAQGVEPTVCRDTSGNYFGFIRSDSAAYPVRFWSSVDNLATVVVTDGPASGFGLRSPVPVCVAGNYLVAQMTGDRRNGGPAGSVGNYYLKARIADALATGFPSFTIMSLGDLYQSGLPNTAVGVGSIIYDGKYVEMAYSSEQPPLGSSRANADVYTLKIKFEGATESSIDTMCGIGSATPTMASNSPDEVYSGRLFSPTAFWYYGRVGSSGAKVVDKFEGWSVGSPSPTGTYAIANPETLTSAAAYLAFAWCDEDGYSAQVVSATASGFNVLVKNSAGTLTNRAFNFMVIRLYNLSLPAGEL